MSCFFFFLKKAFVQEFLGTILKLTEFFSGDKLIVGQHGGAVISAIASQQEGPVFGPWVD